jgi:hypothetical protein
MIEFEYTKTFDDIALVAKITRSRILDARLMPVKDEQRIGRRSSLASDEHGPISYRPQILGAGTENQIRNPF